MQRTLFRMSHDAGLARLLHARDAGAVASTGLGPEDLALLLAAPADAMAADPEGKRRAQFLRNVTSEHALSVALAAASGGRPDESFTASRHFHEAVARDESLPLAFGRHVLDAARASGNPLAVSLALLEQAMAALRRGNARRPSAGAGELVLAPRADVLAFPAGTLEAATSLRAAADAGRAAPVPLAVDAAAREHVLVTATGERRPWTLRHVGVELLSPLAGAFLALASEAPVGREARRDFCSAHDATEEELEAFVAGLVEEGILARGP